MKVDLDKMEAKKEDQKEEVKPEESAGTSGSGNNTREGNKKRPLEAGKGHDSDEDEDEGETVTMEDVLKDAADLEEDAKAVLGGADEKNCTYLGGGYMKRQPLYSCLTCCGPDSSSSPSSSSSSSSSSGGVCLACSYHCHEDHELIELYTKRHFRSGDTSYVLKKYLKI